MRRKATTGKVLFEPTPKAVTDVPYIVPSTYLDLHVHIIFATKHRQAWIEGVWRNELHSYLGGTVRNLGATALANGGVEDHVHALVRLKSTHAVADIVREMKKGSTTWIKENRRTSFAWQEGYAALSVSASAKEEVSDYIHNQEAHHRKQSSAEEFRRILIESGIEIDETYFE